MSNEIQRWNPNSQNLDGVSPNNDDDYQNHFDFAVHEEAVEETV